MLYTDDDKTQKFYNRVAQKKADFIDAAPAFLKNKPSVQLAPSGNGTAKPLQIQAGLEPYDGTLSRIQAAHLLRRTGFGASALQINALTGANASDVVDNIVDAALDTETTPVPPEPVWANEFVPINGTQEEVDAFIQNNIMWLNELQDEWLSTMISVGFRERMTLFWQNHFVTQYDDYFIAMHSYRYLRLLREHALGNLKDFVHAIGTDPAMLKYLDGDVNRNLEPNENYGRELLELFTMSPKDKDGNDNYSQADIEEIARALTGWVIDYLNHTTVFVPSRFDDGEKTFFGRTGSFGYDDVIDIIFEERGAQTAYFVCEKLYREFVYAVPDPDIVEQLATELIANNFEIASVVRILLKSAHFFDAQLAGSHIKSPIDLLAGMPNEVMVSPNLETVGFLKAVASFLEQNLLNPPNVAGWPGYRSWVSTTSLPIRWLVTDFLLFGDNGGNIVDLVPVAKELPEHDDPLAAFKLPVALAEYFMAVPVENLDIGNVSEDFGGDLINFPIPEEITNGPAYAENLAKIFLAGVPWYEWDIESEQAPILLALFARFLTQMPEFHLS